MLKCCCGGKGERAAKESPPRPRERGRGRGSPLSVLSATTASVAAVVATTLVLTASVAAVLAPLAFRRGVGGEAIILNNSIVGAGNTLHLLAVTVVAGNLGGRSAWFPILAVPRCGLLLPKP